MSDLPLDHPEERAARLEFARQIAAETAEWSERKLRMTYGQPLRDEIEDEHRDILKADALEVTKATGVSLYEMQSRCKVPHVVRARHALMVRLRDRHWSYQEIGGWLWRDHSTVCVAVRLARQRARVTTS